MANAKTATPSQSSRVLERTTAVKGKRPIPSPQFIRGGWAGLAIGMEARRAETIRARCEARQPGPSAKPTGSPLQSKNENAASCGKSTAHALGRADVVAHPTCSDAKIHSPRQCSCSPVIGEEDQWIWTMRHSLSIRRSTMVSIMRE